MNDADCGSIPGVDIMGIGISFLNRGLRMRASFQIVQIACRFLFVDFCLLIFVC